MKISEKQGGNFTPHPETDDYIRAVIVDITPLKKRMTAFGEKEEFRIVFELPWIGRQVGGVGKLTRVDEYCDDNDVALRTGCCHQ